MASKRSKDKRKSLKIEVKKLGKSAIEEDSDSSIETSGSREKTFVRMPELVPDISQLTLDNDTLLNSGSEHDDTLKSTTSKNQSSLMRSQSLDETVLRDLTENEPANKLLLSCRVGYLGSEAPTLTTKPPEVVTEPLSELLHLHRQSTSSSEWPNLNTIVKGVDLAIYNSGVLLASSRHQVWYPIKSLYCSNYLVLRYKDSENSFAFHQAASLEKDDFLVCCLVLRETTGIRCLRCHVFLVSDLRLSQLIVQATAHAYKVYKNLLVNKDASNNGVPTNGKRTVHSLMDFCPKDEKQEHDYVTKLFTSSDNTSSASSHKENKQQEMPRKETLTKTRKGSVESNSTSDPSHLTPNEQPQNRRHNPFKRSQSYYYGETEVPYYESNTMLHHYPPLYYSQPHPTSRNFYRIHVTPDMVDTTPTKKSIPREITPKRVERRQKSRTLL